MIQTFDAAPSVNDDVRLDERAVAERPRVSWIASQSLVITAVRPFAGAEDNGEAVGTRIAGFFDRVARHRTANDGRCPVTLADATWLIDLIASVGLAWCAGLLVLEAAAGARTPPSKILDLPAPPVRQVPVPHKLAA
jgi:hypothetical protein